MLENALAARELTLQRWREGRRLPVPTDLLVGARDVEERGALLRHVGEPDPGEEDDAARRRLEITQAGLHIDVSAERARVPAVGKTRQRGETQPG